MPYALELYLDDAPVTSASALPEGQAVELWAMPPPDASLSLAVLGVQLEPFLRPGDPTWRWRWLAPLTAGAYALCLRAVWPDGRSAEVCPTLHVAPRKLDAEHYAALLADLQRLGRAIVFALRGGTSAVALAPTPATLTEEVHTLFGPAFDPFAAAVARLAQRPPDQLYGTTTTVALGRLQDSSRVVQEFEQLPGPQYVQFVPLIKAYGLELVVPHCARPLSVTSAPWAPTARAPTVSV